VRTIKLTQGKVALVDDCDYDVLLQYNWYAKRDKKAFYAVRNIRKVDGKRKTEYMHRIVLARKLGHAITPRMIPDHEDGNGLNNQRYNLREVTHRGNGENKHRSKSSQYLGVCWVKRDCKWQAQIQVNGKIVCFGTYYATEFEAALAREAYIEEHPELLAKSNFIKKLTMKSSLSKLDQDMVF
jgi:hypothetical protein